jgi:hypothetical protein
MLAVGFCIFDGDHVGPPDHQRSHGQTISPDLCLGLVSAHGLTFATGLFDSGSCSIEPVESTRSVSLHLPDPPPKS